MAEAGIRAITFDLWDTVFVDDSDEPKRADEGLAPKPIERRNLVEKFLKQTNPVARELVDVAYDTTDAAFRRVWYGQNITWTVRDRLAVLLKGLNRQLGGGEMDELVRLHEDMELGPRPDIASGVAQVLKELHGGYRLGVISDAIFSPGRALRQLLEHYDLLKYFDSFVFSDEIGFAKPTPALFETAARQLGVELAEIVHIGDREAKDIAGPHGVGAKAILCTVVKDRGSENTKADAICRDFENLPSIMEEMNRE
ncbi:MAG: HAD family hydrolase [Planctomycetes bacterium]|nr:HAD family hydrolase [Planctomycetota bacterium]